MIRYPSGLGAGFVGFLDTFSGEELQALNDDYAYRAELASRSRFLAEAAFRRSDPDALRELHGILADIYDARFGPVPVERSDCDTQVILGDIASILEQYMLEHELGQIPDGLDSTYPTTGTEYVKWLKSLVVHHGAARHQLFEDYLRNRADKDDFRLFLVQETRLDPRFDDILALMSIGRSGREKLEIASNFWDEMGNGDLAEVHTAMFAQSLRTLDIDDTYIEQNLLIEAQIAGNLSACLALSRRHYYMAVGFFGVTEYLVPGRFGRVIEGWRRIGLPEGGIAYHLLHVGIDAAHASGWFKNVVAPAVDADARCGRDIARGALLRLNSSERHLDALLERFEATTR